MARIRAGEKLPRREPKRAYNGAEGVPIREEIISEHGPNVITRNLYGALCLNTPDVLFADIDFSTQPSGRLVATTMALGIATAVLVGLYFRSWMIGIVAIFLGLHLSMIFARGLQKLLDGHGGGEEKRTHDRIHKFLRGHPDWLVRLYRTPSGFRLLAMHRLFKPDEPEALEFFRAVGTDKTYVRMCVNQQCFRARVSPKPWRVGISQHIRPRPGVWPINPERLPERRSWIEAYEKASKGSAACQYMEIIGSGSVHRSADAVRNLHDTLSRASSGLPIA
jgi:hypothetical protein